MFITLFIVLGPKTSKRAFFVLDTKMAHIGGYIYMCVQTLGVSIVQCMGTRCNHTTFQTSSDLCEIVPGKLG